jgi:Domain of unknown function (DUF4396)
MVPDWLDALSIASLVAGGICAAIVLVDVVRFPQGMAIMNWVWPITALYGGPLGLWMYARLGRRSGRRPSWAGVVVSASHCGAGCALGDVIAEFAIFFTGFTLFGSMLATEYIGDYVLAYAFGIVFQFFAIAPMRHLSFVVGIRAAIKSDTLSLTAFEIGLFGWMALSYFVLFRPPLQPTAPAFWFMMQIGMILGFITSYPANWLLIRTGIKEAM